MSTILVTGATGNTGVNVVSGLLAKGVRVRAAVHSRGKAQFPSEVEVVEMNLDDADSVDVAFHGVEKAYLISPFAENLAETGLRKVESARKAGVKYVVRLSAIGADAPRPSIIAALHRKVEMAIEESGLEYTFIRPGFFMQNFIMNHAQTIRTQNAFYAPVGDGKAAFLDARDVAAVAVQTLTDSSHSGKAYTLVGPEALSHKEIAAIFSSVAGREITYREIAEDVFNRTLTEHHMSDWMIKVLGELNTAIRKGYAARTNNEIERITGRKPITFEEFVRDHINSFQ